MSKRTGKYCVTEKSMAVMGRVLSVHNSYDAACRAALKRNGSVEFAEIVALVQGGMPYTAAVQCTAGRLLYSAQVEVSS